MDKVAHMEVGKMADMVAEMLVDMEDDNVADMVLRRSLRWWSSNQCGSHCLSAGKV